VFRTKLLDATRHAGLALPDKLPAIWVVDCRAVGDGQQALLYLGRYLYRGVIQEADILRCDDNGQVTFRYRDAKTDKAALRTLSGADFLWLVLQHVLPKGLRRARNFGFLHPNSAAAIRLLQVLHLRAARSSDAAPTPPRPVWRCVCGQPMLVVCRRMPALQGDVVAQRKPSRVIRPDNPHSSRASTMH
jgi:Putative transposase